MTFINSGHNIDGRITPIHRIVAGGIEVTINNSASQGIFMFGVSLFPVQATCLTPSNFGYAVRGDDPDLIVVLADIDNTLLDKCGQYWRVSGTNFDLGGSGYANDGVVPPAVASLSPCSHGRWVSNAGVPRTVQRTTGIQFRQGTIALPCPGAAETFRQEFNVTAIFTG